VEEVLVEKKKKGEGKGTEIRLKKKRRPNRKTDRGTQYSRKKGTINLLLKRGKRQLRAKGDSRKRTEGRYPEGNVTRKEITRKNHFYGGKSPPT